MRQRKQSIAQMNLKTRIKQAREEVLPEPIIPAKNDISKERPFFYRHLMQNTIHDEDGENSKSLVKNIFYTEDVQMNNPHFNKTHVEIPQLDYTDAEQIENGQKEEPYNKETNPFKSTRQFSGPEPFTVKSLLPEKFHDRYTDYVQRMRRIGCQFQFDDIEKLENANADWQDQLEFIMKKDESSSSDDD